MSAETLERLREAARTFKNDVTQLPGLREALSAHDAAGAAEPPAEPEPAPEAPAEPAPAETPAEPAAPPTEPPAAA